ncbi:hypothetical protein [uncultured Sulfitobacter sp.]|uniref:hypothetical protein n=1 Tax=uncultured Sulfitobacter sp. TaxID=191468 RepID=UPI002603B48C|nr:hypothetical protein [uncultured Sulfitobacter sp.]
MLKKTFMAATIAVLPLAAHAQSFRAINDLFVVPLGGATFEVIEANGEGPRGIWCAAAEYAYNRLGADDRVYLRVGRSPAQSVAGRKAVGFTTDPAALPRAPFTSISLSTSQVGMGLPVLHAIQFCHDDELEPDFGF